VLSVASELAEPESSADIQYRKLRVNMGESVSWDTLIKGLEWIKKVIRYHRILICSTGADCRAAVFALAYLFTSGFAYDEALFLLQERYPGFNRRSQAVTDLERGLRIDTLINRLRPIEYLWVLERLLRFGTGQLVLDVGSGQSPWPKYMRLNGIRVIETDIRNVEPTNDRVLACASNEPFKDESFDAVTCISTIEHVGFEDVYRKGNRSVADSDILALREFSRVVRPGGSIFLTTHFAPTEARFRQGRIYNRDRLDRLVRGLSVEEEAIFVCRGFTGGKWWLVEYEESTEADVHQFYENHKFEDLNEIPLPNIHLWLRVA